MTNIVDGTGSGNRAKVGANNRLYTSAVSSTTVESLALSGDTFNFNTGDITLTSGNESGVAYLKNNEDESLLITSVGFLLGNSTGGTGDLVCKIYSDVSTGTLVSGATATDILVNKNFGSSKTLLADAYKGTEGSTITDGTLAYTSRLAGSARPYVIATGALVLPKGEAIAVSITPQTSNTSMIVNVFMAISKNTLDLN